jgi:predicted nuclease of predicted toxin-antitoxin system
VSQPQFLADESCDFAVVRALRAEGYDVLAVAESYRGAEDQQVIELARQSGRILLTEDKDFGHLIFAAGSAEVGVIFLRFPAREREKLAEQVVKLAIREGAKLKGSFVVVQPGRIRIRRAAE